MITAGNRWRLNGCLLGITGSFHNSNRKSLPVNATVPHEVYVPPDRGTDSGLNGSDRLQSHHIPSSAAVDQNLDDQGADLSLKQRSKLKKDLGVVLLFIENHKKQELMETGQKTKTADAKDLLAAVDADVENLVGNLGVSREQSEKLRGALKDHVKTVTAALGVPCG
ncbi:MAG: hypothetical protein ABJJ69_08520 [Paracoccaceae bacterium]